MVTIFLSVLKITGIVLLCILLFLLAASLLVLLVPIRYQVKGYRKEKEDVPLRAAVHITWLLHLLNASFRYPEEACIRVRILCFTVFSTIKKENAGEKNFRKEDSSKEDSPKKDSEKEDFEKQAQSSKKTSRSETPEKPSGEENPHLLKFLKKLFDILKNIKYTINQIYDKIKHIISNVRYYIGIIESDSFQRAWQFGKSQAVSLIKNILPQKITGNLVIGVGDPAGTARILALHGILYPIIGECIIITPDFDHSILEGDFFIKGKITAFRVLKTALRVYFNKDLQRIIRLFKKSS